MKNYAQSQPSLPLTQAFFTDFHSRTKSVKRLSSLTRRHDPYRFYLKAIISKLRRKADISVKWGTLVQRVPRMGKDRGAKNSKLILGIPLIRQKIGVGLVKTMNGLK